MAARSLRGESLGDPVTADVGQFHRLLVETGPVVSYIRFADHRFGFLYVSPQIETLLGFEPEAFVSQPSFWSRCIHPSDRDFLDVSHGISGQPKFVAEYRMVTREGRIVWVRDSATLAMLEARDVPVYHGVVIDVTADKDAEAELRRLAYYDPLTELPNRRLCMDRLQTVLARPERGAVALLFLDLDRFKVINDGIGHAAGDELLVAVARRLAPHVAPYGAFARFGGDEFVAVLDRLDQVDNIARVAETLLAELRRPFTVNGYDLIVEGTIGAALAARNPTSPQDLLRAADVALYRAKAQGGNAFAVYDPDRDRGGLHRLEQEAELRQALERAEFEIAYQPVVDIESRRIMAVEALLRWRHPERGMLPPAAFLPLADETGLIIPLGQWAIEEACRQVRQWQEQFPAARALQVSVNLSGRQFRQSTLRTDIARALGRSGLPPESLALELKENDALANASDVAVALKAFKELGVRVTIDDFGKGWTALGSLTQFTVDDLKLDGSCIARLGAKDGDLGIVRALVDMARAVGLDVTAAAVETDEQLSIFRDLGCDRAQGHHFSPPLSVAEIEQLFHQGSGSLAGRPSGNQIGNAN